MKKSKLSKEKRTRMIKVFGRFNFHAYIEPFILEMAGHLSEDYNGGVWTSYKTKNGAFYMAPDTNLNLVVQSPNGSVRNMSADAFGVTVCRFAFSHLSFHFKAIGSNELAGVVAEQYHLLTPYVDTHAEAEAIYDICD